MTDNITITLSGNQFRNLCDYAEQNLWREFTDITLEHEMEDLARKAESMGMKSIADDIRQQWKIDTLNQQAKDEALNAGRIFEKLGSYFKP